MKSANPLILDSATPLYLQLEEAIRRDIESGVLSPGQKIPTEMELSASFHVSRVTVRKALALLEEKKYIDRKIGKGTYVAERKLQRNLSGNVTSFTAMCRQMGTAAHSRTIRMALDTASEQELRLLGLTASKQVLRIDRIRYSNDQPVMLERDVFSADFDFLFGEDLNHNSLYEVIRDRRGITFAHASRTIDIVFASAQEARLLDLKSGYPLLRISSVTQNADGTVTTLSEQLCIGDKFKLQV